jgi:hypothetical protein
MNFFKTLKEVFVKTVPDTSNKGTLNKTDAAKLVKTSVLVGVAAAISSALAAISPDTFGPYQPVVIMVLTVSLDLLNKFIKGNK